ncbi:MAG: DNA topoisomerase IV subunit B, partial [Bacteroidales bacterium]|nr:DNA topoisomerase IV subunit B [Bacteroidales bacterium]
MSDLENVVNEKGKGNGYSAESIQVLEGLEAVRKRPAMYIGDVSERGLHHLVYEVIDNSIDEALAGFCSEIEVIIHKNNSITVIDDGRGIPVDWHEKENKSALEVVMTVLHAGGKFNKDSYKVSGGLHGVGVSCVNALSTYLRAEIHRDGAVYQQEFEIGKPKGPVEEIGKTDKTGTVISFQPDASIFTDTVYKSRILISRLRELAFLNKKIRLSLTDERTIGDNGEFLKESFYSEEGLKEYVNYLDESREKLIEEIIYIETEKNGVPVELALQYNTSFNENVHAYVNNINTIEGGTHLLGFRRGLTRTLKRYAEESGLLSKLKFDINGDDFREGLTAVISVKVAEPQFEGQTKGKLGNPEAKTAVDQIMKDAFYDFLEKNPNDAKRNIEKCVVSAKARKAAKSARENVLRKSVFESSSLPGKLVDCSSRKPEDSEVFIVEGNSAGGS